MLCLPPWEPFSREWWSALVSFWEHGSLTWNAGFSGLPTEAHRRISLGRAALRPRKPRSKPHIRLKVGPPKHRKTPAQTLAEHIRWEPSWSGYEVHHVNHDHQDDRRENLLVLTKSAHKLLHVPHPTPFYVGAACWKPAVYNRGRRRTGVCSVACHAYAFRGPTTTGPVVRMPRELRPAWVAESLRCYVAGLPKPLTYRQQCALANA